MKELNLLLADDDFDDAFFFKEALLSMGHEVKLHTVEDGEQLMNYLNNNRQQLPNILFLDLNMPRKNGFECLKEIKDDENLKELPVIIYSTSGQKEVIEILYESGAQFYIQKPDNFKKLKEVIRKALNMAQAIKFSQPRKDQFVLTPLNV